MFDFDTSALIQLLLLIPFLAVIILFLWTQYKTLEIIRPQNRRMIPVLVWLQLIPLVGLVLQFYVITKLSNSIRDELNTPVGDSIFADTHIQSTQQPTYGAGIAYAVVFCIGALPLGMISSLLNLAGLILWIIYWIQLSRFKKQLKDRSMLLS